MQFIIFIGFSFFFPVESWEEYIGESRLAVDFPRMLGGFVCNSGRIDQKSQNEVPAYLHVYKDLSF